MRAAAVASLDKGGFVRRLRPGGVLVRLRFVAGRDDVIASYSVVLRPVVSRKGGGETIVKRDGSGGSIVHRNG